MIYLIARRQESRCQARFVLMAVGIQVRRLKALTLNKGEARCLLVVGNLGQLTNLRTLHFLVSHRPHYLKTSLKINPRPRNSTRNFMGKTGQAPYIHSLHWPIFCCDYRLFGVRGSALSEHCCFHYLRIAFWYTCDMKKDTLQETRERYLIEAHGCGNW